MKRRINQKLQSATGGLRFDIDLRKIGERTSNVPGAFKRTTEFGILPTGASGEPPLDKYLSKIELLRGQLQKEEDTRGPNLDPRLVADRLTEALNEAQNLLQPLDDKARVILTPLLTNPLKIVTAKLPPGGANKVAVPGRGLRR
jgi:type VI secretion system protein ImpL